MLIKLLFSKRTLVKAKKLVFPKDKELTPQDHSNALLIALSQYETSMQSDIIAQLKEDMIKDRENTIAELTADLEKLRKI